MRKAEQFRENAEEAMHLCRQSGTEDAKSADRPCPHLEVSRGIEREEVCRSAGAKGLTTARSKLSATFKLLDRHLLAHYRRLGCI